MNSDNKHRGAVDRSGGGESPSPRRPAQRQPPDTRDIEIQQPPVSETNPAGDLDGGEVRRGVPQPHGWVQHRGGRLGDGHRRGGQYRDGHRRVLGASLVCQPAIWFFYSPNAPAGEAELLASDFQRLGTPGPRRATGRDDRWEVQAMLSTHPARRSGQSGIAAENKAWLTSSVRRFANSAPVRAILTPP